MTYAELLRRSLEAEAAETVPPRSLVQAVLEQARHRTSGRSPPLMKSSAPPLTPTGRTACPILIKKERIV